MLIQHLFVDISLFIFIYVVCLCIFFLSFNYLTIYIHMFVLHPYHDSFVRKSFGPSDDITQGAIETSLFFYSLSRSLPTPHPPSPVPPPLSSSHLSADHHRPLLYWHRVELYPTASLQRAYVDKIQYHEVTTTTTFHCAPLCNI